MICTTFAIAALGVAQNSGPDVGGRLSGTESLWGTTGWLAAVLIGGAATLLAIKRWAPNSNEILFGIVGLLIGIGWVFVARIDAPLAPEHAVAVLVGFAAIAGTLAAARHLDRLLSRPGAWGIAAGVLLAAGSFATGTEVSGGTYEAPRQLLNLGTQLSVQPYGLAKIGIILAGCGLTASAPRWLAPRFVPHRHTAGASAAAIVAWTLLIIGGDLATSVIVFTAAWLPLWLDGDDFVNSDIPTVGRSVRARALSGVIATYAVGVIVLVTVNDRLSAQVRFWLNPWSDADGATIVDAAFAISAGGISGVGPGLGAPQRLAEPHSDFIFAVIAEELGVLGGAALIVAFTLLVGVGAGIAQRAQGAHRLLAAAAAAMIGLQAFFAIAGVLRLLPHTVGALPFVAHGPLAMVGNCVAVALLLAVSDVSWGSRLGRNASPPVVPDVLQMNETSPQGAPTGELRAPAEWPDPGRRQPVSEPSRGEPQQLPLGDP